LSLWKSRTEALADYRGSVAKRRGRRSARMPFQKNDISQNTVATNRNSQEWKRKKVCGE
jgi:hypothetical protein